jgi:hypothetical protein
LRQALEVARISESPAPGEVRKWLIDHPEEGARTALAEFRISGWIVPAAAPVRAVELMLEGRRVRAADVGLPRPGVAEAFGDALATDAGFRAHLNLSALPEGAELEIAVRATLADSGRAEVGSVRVRRVAGPGTTEEPLVSVVVPCWNQAHYLGEAIESVLAQTYSELELVVVDDGSDDNSYEVASRYPGVRCLRQLNRGVATARNTGLAETQGRYVVFLDADDRLLPNALGVGVQELLAQPKAAFAAGMPRDIARDGTVTRVAGQPFVTRDHYLRLLEECFIWSGSSVVYRREALEAVGAFDQSRTAADDYELYLKLARAYPVACHEAVVTEYRRHGTNTTRDAGLVLSSQIQVLNGQRRHLRNREERVARRLGIRNTRAKQGEALIERVANARSRREWRPVLRGLRTLARWDPGAFLRYRRRGVARPGGRFEHLQRELSS